MTNILYVSIKALGKIINPWEYYRYENEWDVWKTLSNTSKVRIYAMGLFSKLE